VVWCRNYFNTAPPVKNAYNARCPSCLNILQKVRLRSNYVKGKKGAGWRLDFITWAPVPTPCFFFPPHPAAATINAKLPQPKPICFNELFEKHRSRERPSGCLGNYLPLKEQASGNQACAFAADSFFYDPASLPACNDLRSPSCLMCRPRPFIQP